MKKSLREILELVLVGLAFLAFVLSVVVIWLRVEWPFYAR